MRSGTIVSTMLAATITVAGLALVAETIRPAAVATVVVRRALFLADLARLDALLTRTTARGGVVDGSAECRLPVHRSDPGVRVWIDGKEHRFDRVGIDSIECASNPVPLLHVTAFDPHRGDRERWHLIAPLGDGRVP